MKILKNQKDYEIQNGWIGGETYIEDLNVSVHQHRGSITIMELEGALRVGKTCVEHSVGYRNSSDDSPADFLNWLTSKNLNNIEEILDYLKGQELVQNRWGYHDPVDLGEYNGTEFKYSRSESKGVRVYSPFNTKYIKPLKEMPSKWNLTHVIKAIVNGQYENLYKNYHLTDDYAYDNAFNFQEGEIDHGQEFIKKIIERPSGWWTSLERNNVVSVCCHTFDSNQFQLKLN